MITVRIDSAGGTQCLVFLRDGKVFFTYWFPEGVWFNNISLPPGAGGELYQLFETMRAFEVPHAQMQEAVTALFKEKGLL